MQSPTVEIYQALVQATFKSPLAPPAMKRPESLHEFVRMGIPHLRYPCSLDLPNRQAEVVGVILFNSSTPIGQRRRLDQYTFLNRPPPQKSTVFLIWRI